MRLVAVISLLAFALSAATAAVASAASDPSRLVLARADFPAGASYASIPMQGDFTKALAAAGIKANAVGYHVQMGNETADGFVTTTGAASQAKKLYALMKDDVAPKPSSIVRVPSYGDEQFATFDAKDSKAELYVRKGSTVWQLEVNLSLKTKAQTLAKLKTYAAKQKSRIGSG